MSERFERKAKDTYTEHKRTAGQAKLANSLKKSAEESREYYGARSQARTEAMAALDISDNLREIQAQDAATLRTELDADVEKRARGVADAQKEYDKALKKGARHYNRNKGQYREAALADAAQAGVAIDAPDALPPVSQARESQSIDPPLPPETPLPPEDPLAA